MAINSAEAFLQRLGGLAALVILGVVLYGYWRGTRRNIGRTTGRMYTALRAPWFYLGATAFFIGISYLLWIPLPIPAQHRPWMLILGSILYFPGVAIILWGRLTLGKYYFVSTSLGAQLFEGHKLVTTGPYAFVRHPMYLGLFLAAIGGLLLYATWTTLLLAFMTPMFTLRARREEEVLAKEFGEEWWAYSRRVPAFFPRMRSAGNG